MTTQPPDDGLIFVNYRRTDAGWPANTLVAALRAAFGAERVFQDVRSIDAGNDFGEEIETNLEHATILFVLIGERWLFAQDKFGRRRLDSEQDWVRREIRHGLGADRCTVIPLVVDGTDLPDEADALPQDIHPILRLQRLSVRQAEPDADIGRIVERAEQLGVPRLPLQPGETHGTSPATATIDSEIAGYLEAAEAAHKEILLAGFETKLRVPIDLEDMYVPLHASVDMRGTGITRAGSAEEMECDLHNSSELPLTEAFKRAKVLRDRHGLVILGDPGSGKTTHLKRLLLWLIRKGTDELGLPAGMVPVFLPLRELQNLGAGLDELFQSHLDDNPHLTTAEGFAARLLKRGNILFLLDGLDEVPETGRRQEVVQWVENAVKAHRDCRFVVTCRYAGYRALAEQFTGRFLELHLRPLNEAQATTFIHNWFRIVETGLGGRETVAKAAADELVARLKERDFRSARVFELTRNPLLLTAICLVHRDRGQLPHRRGDLYEECTNVLLEGWRRKAGLGMDAKTGKRILQPVAHWLHGVENRSKATGCELETLIEPALAQVGEEKLTPTNFLSTVRDECGLLTGWSGDSYGFMHLGFQEYLAARHIGNRAIAEPALLKALAERFGDPWWREVTLLLVALDGVSLFEPLMNEVLKSADLRRGGSLLGMCLDEAREVTLGPFLRQAKKKPGTTDAHWGRQLAAIQILRERAPELLRPQEKRLAKHPCPEIAALFEEGQRFERTKITTERGRYELVRIPGGSFMMGSTAAEQQKWADGDKKRLSWFKNESPQHRVDLGDFYIGQRPVTNAQYARFLADNPGIEEPNYWGGREYNRPSNPVVGVSWRQAQAFCDWSGLALPTEAQWEYACRAGSDTAFWSGDEEEELLAVGWYASNSGGRIHPVGQKPANPFGLYDMHGNIWEWCRDCSLDYKKPTEPSTGFRTGTSRGIVFRGGCYDGPATGARSAFRHRAAPGYCRQNLGFRPVKGPT